MSNKLTKRDIPGWGEDLSAFLELCRKEDDTSLTKQVEEKVLAGYLLAIRRVIQENHRANKIAAEAVPAISAKPFLVDILWDLARPGSEDLFEKAVEIILTELEAARLAPPSMYLVNTQTGRATIPLTKESVFQPPDYVGEDGLTHRARPVVHPAITSAMALAQQESHRREILNEKASLPEFRHALAHLSGPDDIINSAKTRLEAAGVTFTSTPVGSDSIEVEFGRESLDGILQAPNYKFHRQNSFSAILAQKILKICKPGGRCHITPAKEMKNSKQKWFVVVVTPQDPPQNLPH